MITLSNTDISEVEIEKLKDDRYYYKKENKRLLSELKTCKDKGFKINAQLIAARRDRNTERKNLTKELEDCKKRCAELETELVSLKR